MWKKRLQAAGWCSLALGMLVLLVAAMHKKDHISCREIKVEIEGAQDHVFVDEKEVLSILRRNGAIAGTRLLAIPLRKLEALLERDPWIRQANLFFDNNQVLQVQIEESEPLARVFTLQGSSFYLDSSGQRLPLSDQLSARVPVFTAFPSDRAKLSGPDSAVLQDVKHIAQFISKDSFWMAQVSQVDITSGGRYELVPVIGNHIVVLGDATDLEKKFDRLYSFYKQVWVREGMEQYGRIDVQYKGQVVAVHKGTDNPAADSGKAVQALTGSMEKIKAVLEDTSGVQSLPPAVAVKAVKDTLTAGKAKAPPAKPSAAAAGKRTTTAPVRAALQKGPPRAVMPKATGKPVHPQQP